MATPAAPAPSPAASGVAASGAAIQEGATAAVNALEALRAQVAALQEEATAAAGAMRKLNAAGPAKSRGSPPETSRPRKPETFKFEPAGNHSVRYIARQLGVGREGFRAPITAAAVGLLKMAIQDTAGLSAVTARAKANFRSLFAGIDSTPLTRGMAMLTSGLNPATQSGKALAGIFNDTFGGLFRIFEKIAPYARAAFDGMVLGALYAENTLLDLEIGALKLALAFPKVTGAVKGFLGPVDGLKIAAYGGVAALGALAMVAAGAGAPFVALGEAIVAVNAALKMFRSLNEKYEGKGGSAWWMNAKHNLGITSDEKYRQQRAAMGGKGDEGLRTDVAREEAEKRKDSQEGVLRRKYGESQDDVLARKYGAPAGATAAVPTVQPAGGPGMATGKAYADGVAAGVLAGAPAVNAAGGALVEGLDASARTAADAHSPSRVAERTGATYPAGMARGVDSGADDVQAAADRSLAPKMTGGYGSAAGSSSAPSTITIINQWPDGVTQKAKEEIETACEAAIYRALRATLGTLAIPTRIPS